VEQNAALKDKKRRTQINGKCNDESGADENKKISLYSPYFKTIKSSTFIHR
jgi:hypothetical protein